MHNDERGTFEARKNNTAWWTDKEVNARPVEFTGGHWWKLLDATTEADKRNELTHKKNATVSALCILTMLY